MSYKILKGCLDDTLLNKIWITESSVKSFYWSNQIILICNIAQKISPKFKKCEVLVYSHELGLFIPVEYDVLCKIVYYSCNVKVINVD